MNGIGKSLPLLAELRGERGAMRLCGGGENLLQPHLQGARGAARRATTVAMWALGRRRLRMKVLDNFHYPHDHFYRNDIVTVTKQLLNQCCSGRRPPAWLCCQEGWNLTWRQVCDNLHFSEMGSQIYRMMTGQKYLNQYIQRTGSMPRSLLIS